MARQIEPSRSRPPIMRRAVAALILVAVAVLVFHIVAGLIVMQFCFEWLRARTPDGGVRVAFILLFGATVAVEVRQIRPLHAWSIGHGELKYGRIATWLNAHVPKNSAMG